MPRRGKGTRQATPVHAAAGETKRITPVEIQQREFRLAFRGYNERDVDQFLDEVTEEVARLYAETKRLRDELEFARTSRLDLGAVGEADALLRRAREESDRILSEARSRAGAAVPGSGGATALGPYISRERDFLQRLANLIQEHAEAVKEQIRRSRSPESPPPPPAASEPAEEPPVHQHEDAAGPPTEPWTPEETVGSPPPESHRRSHQDEILDLTEPPKEDAGRTTSPNGPEPAEEDGLEDRSVRELFWGEE